MILLTGATGIIGHFIAENLLRDGHKVRALRRQNSNITRLGEHQNLEWAEADVEDLPALKKAFEGVEYVLHCAAVVSFHQEDKKKMMDVNISGTANMINLALEHKVKKFVHLSSVAALGRKEGALVIDETTKWEESKNNSNYAKSKNMGELEVWRGQEEGLNTVILNPSIVLGPGDWNTSSMQIFKYVSQGRKFYPNGEMNYVDVRDVTDICTKMLFNDISGERFILNAGKVYYKNVFELIGQYLNKPAPRYRVSYALLNFAYVFDTIRSSLTRQKAIITKESLRLSKMSFYFSSDKITEALDFKFKTLEDSISWTCNELKKTPME
jgi:nucleoside-diphosphate-sugar epimerase